MLPFQTLYQEQSNNDKAFTGGDTGLGNFHKSVRKLAGTSGQVDPKAFAALLTETGTATPDYARVPRGVVPGATSISHAPFVNPQAGLSQEASGPDPQLMTMPPAPSVVSADTAAEMVELYHMALLRDLPFDQWATDPRTTTAVTDVTHAYSLALAAQTAAPISSPDGRLPIVDNGAIRLGLDLPANAGTGALNIGRDTLFRCGLPGEDKGPLVSQFFMHDVAYGTQLIEQMQYPYAAQRDYLTTLDDWAHAQSLGRSPLSQRDYTHSQPTDDNAAFESPRLRKRIRNMRDLARFVHKDALHQAYFNAALLLSNWGARLDSGNPYANSQFAEVQIGFGTLGVPHLLTLVSEVASRALKVVWRQKWNVHLRLRPEAYGGALEHVRMHPGAAPAQHTALWNHFIAFGLDNTLLSSIQTHNLAQQASTTAPTAPGSVLLPMAFESGSPVHPAYGAGHATVAGACVTLLKAWFDEDTDMSVLLANNNPTHPVRWQERVQLVQPGHPFTPSPLTPAASSGMTVGGELNKLASNVAMGRSMGGVHWRTDNTRSLRLGEQIATILMRRQCRDYAEGTPTWSYTSFDNHKVLLLSNGRISVDGNPALERFYNQAAFAPLN